MDFYDKQRDCVFDFWSSCCSHYDQDMTNYVTKDELEEAISGISGSSYDDTEIRSQIEALQGAIVSLTDRVSTLEGIVAQKANSSALTAIWDAISECCSGSPVPPEPPTPTGTTKKFVITVSGGSNIEADCDSDYYLDATQTKQDSSTFMRYLTAEIGDCITEIGNGVFLNCFNMESITVPSGVTDIHNYAFATSYVDVPVKHLDLYIYATVPPTLHDDDEAFYGYFPADCTIYVPAESLTAYRTAWSEVADKIQAIQ